MLNDITTVGDLIEFLQDFPEDAEVLVAAPSGDNWRTIVASPVDNVVQGNVVWSEYHRQFKVLESGTDDEEQDDEVKSRVLLDLTGEVEEL